MQPGLPPSGAPPQGMEGQMPNQQFMQPGTLQPMQSTSPPPPPGMEPGNFVPPPPGSEPPPPEGSVPPPPADAGAIPASGYLTPDSGVGFILKVFEPILGIH